MKKTALLLLLGIFQVSIANEYFQQRVDYSISARLIPAEAKIEGTENIFYKNNSPDYLDAIYFYIYLNAFKPGSNLDLESRRRGSYRLAEMPPALWGEIILERIKLDGIDFEDDYNIDDTILKLPLEKKLAPGDSITIYFEFTAVIPTEGFRLGHQGNHFDMAEWFPKAAVYDKYGWHLSQYQAMSEPYSDFGDYNVRITAPVSYILAYCGNLLNEEDIYGAKLAVPTGDSILVDLLSNIKIGNKSDRIVLRYEADRNVDRKLGTEVTGTLTKIESGDSTENIPSKEPVYGPPIEIYNQYMLERPFIGLKDYSTYTGTRTWIFRSENAHDFAFSADPNFIIDRAYSNGVIIDCYYMKFNAAYWSTRSIVAAREAIEYYSQFVGPYRYDHYTLVSGGVHGGIEYPTFSIVNARYGMDPEDHGFERIIAHEIAHNWFYGMIASNQAEQAFIDEGFTTFLTCLFIENKYGRLHNSYTYTGKLKKRFLPNGNERNDLFLNYVNTVYNGEDQKINIPANLFDSRQTVRMASYDKPAVILFHLQYVLGEKKFRRFLHELYNRWSFRHPHLEDIEQLATEIYGRSLRYFFSQWYDSDWYIDYKLDGVKSRLAFKDGINWYETDITIKQNGRAISPIDITVKYENGESEVIWIPETVWADGRRSYTHNVYLPLKPTRIEINPDGSIPDINRLNNNWRWPRFQFQFNGSELFYKGASAEYYPDRYLLTHWPGIWYNEVDGVKVQYNLDGSYLGLKRNLELKTSLGSLNGRIDYSIKYEDLLSIKHPGFSYSMSSYERDGRGEQNLAVIYQTPGDPLFKSLFCSIAYKRQFLFSKNYLSDPQHWQYGDINTLDLTLEYMKNGKMVDHHWLADIMDSAPGSDYRFSRSSFAWSLATMVSPTSVLSFRLAGGLSEGEVPSQYRFYQAQASPYDYFDDKWYSSRGTLPVSLKRRQHLFLDDGISMPGYLYLDKSGLKQLGGRIQLEIANPVEIFELPYNAITRELAKIRPKIYVTHSAVWDDPGLALGSDFLSELGLRFSYKIPYWDRIFGDETFDLYLPLVISDPQNDESSLKFRWAISISR